MDLQLLLVLQRTYCIINSTMVLRITVCVVTSALGLLSISLGDTKFLTIFGVVLGSISTGLGEISILPFLHKYAKENITSWSSGTGASGIVAATAYTSLKTILSTENTILVMLIVPLAQAIAFGLMLVLPNDKLITQRSIIITKAMDLLCTTWSCLFF